MTLVCDANAVIVMHLEVLVTPDEMDKITAALADNADEARAFARDILFTEPMSRKTARVEL